MFVVKGLHSFIVMWRQTK